MMSEAEVRDLFAEAGDEITTRPAPVDELVRDGRRTTRVRRGLQVGGVVAVVGLVIAAGLVWRPATEPAGEPATPPQAPAGMRLVGMGRVAVAVPEDWGTNDFGCGTAIKDTVVFNDGDGQPLCEIESVSGERMSALHIGSADSGWAQRLVKRAGPIGAVDGVPILRAATREDGDAFAGGVVVQSEDVAMWVSSPDAGIVDKVLGSVMIVPDGYLAVPARDDVGLLTQAMKSAGLVVDVVEQPKPGWSVGSLISSDPPLGSVVPVGSTVTLVVTGERSAELPIATSDWRPGDGSDDALIGGVLRARADGCLSTGGVDIVWPADYSAARRPDGSVVVMRPDGQVVAQTGRPFEAAGGVGPAPADMPCRVRPGGEVMFVQSVLPPLTSFVPVPDLVGLSQNEAVRVLDDLGLNSSTLFFLPADRDQVDTVTSQLQTPGTKVEPGSTIEITIGAPHVTPGTVLPADSRLADALYELAARSSGTSAAAVPFAPEVQLGLADQYLETVDRAALSEPDTWVLQHETFRARGGPFSALDLLRDSGGSYDVSVGPHPPCNGDLVLPPPSLSGLRQVSIQAKPSDYTSCIDWWSVDVFVDHHGEVAGVTLDLYEP